VNGNTTFNVTGYTVDPLIDSGNVTIIAGTASNEIVVPYHECNIRAVVTGNTALIVSGFSCSLHSEFAGFVANLTFTSGNLVRNNNVIFNKSSGNVQFIDNVTALTVAGQFTVDDSLTKVGK
jgi:hypothetical protein